MYNWFECKVSFDKMGEDGLLKRTSLAVVLFRLRANKSNDVVPTLTVETAVPVKVRVDVPT